MSTAILLILIGGPPILAALYVAYRYAKGFLAGLHIHSHGTVESSDEDEE